MVWSEAARGRLWLPASAAAVLGVGAGLWLPLWLPAAWTGLVCCAIVALVQARRGRTLIGPTAAWSALLLVLLLRASSAAHPDPSPPLEPYLPGREPPILRLQATSEPEWSIAGHRFEARWLGRCRPRAASLGLDCARRWGQARVDVIGRDVRVHIGDVLRVPAFASPAPGYANPGAYNLAPRWQLAGIVAEVRVHKSESIVVEPASGLRGPLAWLLRLIGSARRTLTEHLMNRVPGRAGAVLAALALGDRSSTDPALQDWLAATGTTHVMAVSGSHLAIAVWLAQVVLGWALRCLAPALLRRNPLDVWLALPCIAIAWGYALLTGAAASTLRAAVMVTVLLGARAWGRRHDLGESLGCAVTVLLLWDPAVLADVGFVLSVLGVLGLAWAGAAQPRQGGSLGLRDHLRSLWRSCLGPSATTAPVVLGAFGALPLASPLANAVLVPLTALLLPWALLATALASLPLGGPARGLLATACQWSVVPLEFGMRIPRWALPVWRADGVRALLLGACVPLLLAALWQGGVWRRRALIGVLLGGACFGWLGWVERLPEGSVRAFVLDVGHGDSTWLEFPDGSNMLVDGGGELGDQGRVGRLAVLPFLQRRGVSHIDRMVLTHAHPDHENGLLAVASALPVAELWWNGQMPKGAEHLALVAELNRQGTRWRNFARGSAQRAFRWGDVQVRVLWPAPERAPYQPSAGMNDNSLVLDVEASGRRLLLAGDIEADTEAALCTAGTLGPIDVLKVPHHGSRTSSTPQLLATLVPRLAIAGARPWGSLPFPHPEIRGRYAQAGIPLWTTAEGFVTLELGPEGTRARQGERWIWLPRRAAAASRRSEVKAGPAPGQEHRAAARVAAVRLADVGRDHRAVLALGARQEVAAVQGDCLEDLLWFAARHDACAYTAGRDRCQSKLCRPRA